MEEIKQNQLIKQKKNDDIKKTIKNVKGRTEIPSGYYPIRLSTKGKLSVPEILHFRNFNMSEIIDLSVVTDEEEKMFVLISCLNKMVYEDIKCEDLHEKELTEIMMNLYFIFTSNKIGPWNYYINENLKGEALNSKDNLGKIEFSNNDLNTISIPKKFKEPIIIKNDIKEVHFMLPRIQNTLIAREYVLEKYKNEKEKYIDIERKIAYNQNQNIQNQLKISEEAEKEYNNYIKEKGKDFLRVFEASLILSYNKKEINLEKALELFDNNEVDLGIWSAYNTHTKNILFGINEEVTFIPEKKKEPITRRFSFRPDDFIPDVELQGNSGYTISYGN